MSIPILFPSKDKCSGCSACYSICPMSAISMIPDQEGFQYPIIDEKKCIDCRQCINVCPFKRKIDEESSDKLYKTRCCEKSRIKVGIITHYYKSTNYGGLLQAYALCTFLQKKGYNVEQICYDKQKGNDGVHKLKRVVRNIVNLFYFYLIYLRIGKSNLGLMLLFVLEKKLYRIVNEFILKMILMNWLLHMMFLLLVVIRFGILMQFVMLICLIFLIKT
ncbi:hypothetical protein EC1_04960 [Faecalitalea cylindroides T2-87]|uniref:4Fe-4S ferredoxin-type domain-containing protein n=1 Tax=Faecalitalea cylindroides T2-87 TaxID=717960 RepID=D4JD96_9FIRM|nr:hypothetical protein EC1_04960 [Faecalitalea cylindroides T2-87]